MRPVLCIPDKILDASERSPIEIIGEKSICPIVKNLNFEKNFQYGSVSEEINFPKAVNFAPGSHDIMILIKHKTV